MLQTGTNNDNDKQLYFSFYLVERQKVITQKQNENYTPESNKLPFYKNANTDNKKLMNLQRQYILNKDTQALSELYILSAEIASKLIAKYAKKNKHIAYLDKAERQEKAHNAAVYIIEQFIKRPSFFIKKSYTGYLYKRVQKELFYTRKTDKNIFYLEDLEQAERKNIRITNRRS